uniref:24 kDa family member n=1 Tax=Rhipicephalus appendiculatus TaxID=34631 RepID=A0A131YNM6_RHIAP
MSVLRILVVATIVTSSSWAPAIAATTFPTNATATSTQNPSSQSNSRSNSTSTVASTVSTPSTTSAQGGNATTTTTSSRYESSTTSTKAGSSSESGSTAAEATTASTGTTTGPEETTPMVPPSSDNVTIPDTTTRLASDDTCIQGAIPNVMNIGECLGDDLDLCTGKKTAGQAYMSLVRCTAKVTFENMSPMNALIALRDIFTTIVHRYSPRAAAILQNINLKPDGSDLNNNICKEPIRLGFPNSLGKCLGETYKLCDDGEMIDVSFATSFAAAVACGFTELATTTPIDTFRSVVCDIIMGSQAMFGVIPFIGTSTYEFAKAIYC